MSMKQSGKGSIIGVRPSFTNSNKGSINLTQHVQVDGDSERSSEIWTLIIKATYETQQSLLPNISPVP